MRSISRRLIVVAVTALTLAVSAVLAGDAGAMQKGGQKKKKNNNLVNAQLVQELVRARTLVHNADHDYNGYRAKAAHQIRQAIHALEPKHKHPKLPPVSGSNNQPQSVSDKHLQQAMQILQTVHTQMSGATAKHHVTAQTHVTNAYQDLQTALKIK